MPKPSSTQELIKKLLDVSIKQKCPRCGQGKLFRSVSSLETVEECASCKFPWQKHDSGDGPAVFLSFILGFSVVPLALIINALYDWPLWLHTLVWSALIFTLSIGLLKPSKAITIALQYYYRPTDWSEEEEDKNGKQNDGSA